MSKNTTQHKYFGQLEIDEYNSFTGEMLFPPTNNKVQILTPSFEDATNLPNGCEQFYKELILFYPELSKKIQEILFEMRDDFDVILTIDDVWKVFQLETIFIDSVDLDNSEYWSLSYGTDYGGHIIVFEMAGKEIVDSFLEG